MCEKKTERLQWQKPRLTRLDTRLATMGGSTRNGEGGPRRKS